MSRLDVVPGDRLTVDGQEHVVVRLLEGGRLHLENDRTCEPVVVSEADLLGKWLEGRVTLKVRQRPDRFGAKVATRLEQMRRDFEALDERSKVEARRRLLYVKEVLAAGPRSLTQASLKPLLPPIAESIGERIGPLAVRERVTPYVVAPSQRRAPSASSVCRWISLWRRSGEDIRVLVGATHRRGNRKRRLQQEVIDSIDFHIRAVFMGRPRNTARDVWDNVISDIRDINLTRAKADRVQPPSLRCVHRAIAVLDKRDVAAARHGLKRAKQEFAPVGKSCSVSRPLQRVEIDHTRLDVIVVDERTDLPIGRPTITVLVDVYSRMFVGWHIGFDPPGCTAVAHALRHAILPKRYVKTLYPDISGDYAPYGRPHELVCDIGPEFLSVWFVDACNSLGINLLYCPGGTPSNKGHVERAIRTLLEDFVHKIPGTTFSGVLAKGDYDAEGGAVVTRADLEYVIHLWIICIYSKSRHRGLMDVPERVWLDGVARHPVSMPPRVEDLNALLSKIETRTLQRTGIEYSGLRYNDAQVAALLRRHGSGYAVRIRVDPDNLDHVYVQDAPADRWLDVPSIDPEYTKDLTLAQHRIVAESCRKRINEHINIDELCAARVRLQKVVSRIFRAKNGKRPVRAALFLGVGQPNVVRDAQERSSILADAGGSPEPTTGWDPPPANREIDIATSEGAGGSLESELLDLDAEVAALGWGKHR